MQEMYLDRDFLKTPEGFLFCVVGCVHPRDRALAYLKYVPSKEGQWASKDGRYRRTMQAYTMPALLGSIENLRLHFPQYVFNSKVMGIQMSAVPRKHITVHYSPSTKLGQLSRSKSRDRLEDRVVRLVRKLSEASGIEKESFGITGSVLLGIHSQEFSDMDIVVYGHSNAQSAQKVLQTFLSSEDPLIKPLRDRPLKEMILRWTQSHQISVECAKWFAKRKWNRGIFADRRFSILPVRSPREVSERYGEEYYSSEGILEGVATIADATNSCFLPSSYVLEHVEPSSLTQIRYLVSYDSFHSGIFQKGDAVRFRGKLEKVLSREGIELCRRVLIGSPEAHGLDYIRPILS